MSGRLRATLVGLCIAATLIACRPADTPAPAAPVPANTSSSQPSPGLMASTPMKPTATPPEFIPSPNNLLRVRHMVLSVTLFTLSHELGHMVVDEYAMPMIAN